MKPIELAEKYMECVFENLDFDRLMEILDSNLRFRGPLFQFNSAEDYIHSLVTDPPVNFKYRMIRTYEDDKSVCLIYEFSKPEVQTTMAQTFDVKNGKIVNILLVFDTKAFDTDLLR